MCLKYKLRNCSASQIVISNQFLNVSVGVHHLLWGGGGGQKLTAVPFHFAVFHQDHTLQWTVRTGPILKS